MSFRKRSTKINIKRPIRCLFALSLGVLPISVFADEYDTLQFNTSVNRAYDNNLFRVRNNETSDQITTYTAGVKLDKTYSLQRFIVDVNYVDYKYQNSDFLNFDTINYDAKWLWSLTPSLTGNFSTSRNKTLNGFNDFRFFTQNIRTVDINQFKAEYSPYRIWGLIAGLTETDVNNSQTFNAQAQYKATAFDYGARYKFSSGSKLTFLGHKRNGQFERNLNTSLLFDNGFTEDEYEFDFVLKPMGKSNLSGKLAHLSREYDNFSTRDYGVWIGFLKYDLLLTGKIRADLDLSRTAYAFETDYSTYSVTDSASLGLSYLYTEKLTFMLNGRIAQRGFEQPVVAGIAKREDDEQSLSASVSWRPIQSIGFTLSSIKSKRNASSAYNNFDYDDVTTSVMVDLKI